MSEPSRSRPSGLASLIGRLDEDAHRPALVCHLPGGARTELSGASLANWTAKVAGLLRDELALGPGDVAAVQAGTGWQLAPVLLGSWWAGLAVTDTDTALVGAGDGAAVAFVDPGSDADADEVFVLSGHPLGAPATDIFRHQRDFTTAALPQTDRLGASAAAGDSWVAAWTAQGPVTASELMRSALDGADRLGGADRPVLLSAVDWTMPDGVAETLLACLVAGGTLVHCAADLPADRLGDRLGDIARSEHVTASVGVEIPGLTQH